MSLSLPNSIVQYSPIFSFIYFYSFKKTSGEFPQRKALAQSLRLQRALGQGCTPLHPTPPCCTAVGNPPSPPPRPYPPRVPRPIQLLSRPPGEDSTIVYPLFPIVSPFLFHGPLPLSTPAGERRNWKGPQPAKTAVSPISPRSSPRYIGNLASNLSYPVAFEAMY